MQTQVPEFILSTPPLTPTTLPLEKLKKFEVFMRNSMFSTYFLSAPIIQNIQVEPFCMYFKQCLMNIFGMIYFTIENEVRIELWIFFLINKNDKILAICSFVCLSTTWSGSVFYPVPSQVTLRLFVEWVNKWMDNLLDLLSMR